MCGSEVDRLIFGGKGRSGDGGGGVAPLSECSGTGLSGGGLASAWVISLPIHAPATPSSNFICVHEVAFSRFVGI